MIGSSPHRWRWPGPPEFLEFLKLVPSARARVDLIEETETEIVLSDIKTARSKWSQADAELRADQLVIYRHAFQNLAAELGKPIVAACEVVTKVKSSSVERIHLRDVPAGIDRQLKLATVMVEGVEKGVFLPNPSWACATCPWAGPCRAW